MTRKCILVTGSDGLIGTAVCNALAAGGFVARGFDLNHTDRRHGDIRDAEGLRAAMRGCAGVIHLAAVSRVLWGQRDPEACRDTNVIGTQKVVETALQSAASPWLIFGSSREVYGQCPEQPVVESAPLRPMNTYARSKVAAEAIVQQATGQGLRGAILRFSTVYGDPRDHADRVIPAFCRAALAGRPLSVEGRDNSLDITHVSDVARAIVTAANRLEQGATLPPLHLTTGHATRLEDLARRIIRLAGSDSPVLFAPHRRFDVSTFAGDPAQAVAHLDWTPRMPLDTGLSLLIAQLRAAGAESLDANAKCAPWHRWCRPGSPAQAAPS